MPLMVLPGCGHVSGLANVQAQVGFEPGAVLIGAIAVGHIPGTSCRDLSRNDENRRDLSRRSDHMRGAFAMVRETLAQDPAYRPAHPRTGL